MAFKPSGMAKKPSVMAFALVQPARAQDEDPYVEILA
jgi:hypothetical protein